MTLWSLNKNERFKLPPIRGTHGDSNRHSPINGSGNFTEEVEKSYEEDRSNNKPSYNATDEVILTPENESNIDPIYTNSPKGDKKERRHGSDKRKATTFDNPCDDDMIWKSINGVPRDSKIQASRYTLFNDSNIILNDYEDSDVHRSSEIYSARRSEGKGAVKNNPLTMLASLQDEKESSYEGMSTIFEVVDKNEIELVEGRRCYRLCKIYKSLKVYTNTF